MLSTDDLLKISDEISKKYTPKKTLLVAKSKTEAQFKSAELLKISNDISHYYAPKLLIKKKYLRLLSVDPGHIYVYWNLHQTNNNALQKSISQNELALRIYKQTEDKFSPILSKPVIEIPVHNFQYKKKLSIPIHNQATCYSASIGEYKSEQKFMTLVESNALHIEYNSSFISPLTTEQHHNLDQNLQSTHSESSSHSTFGLILNRSGTGKQ